MRTSRRLAMMCGLAVALGVAGGGAAWVLIHLIGFITNVALFGRVRWDVPSLAHYGGGYVLVLAAVVGGALISLLALWSPVIRGHGIPEAMEAVLERQSRIPPRAALAKPLSAAIAIGTGGPFGAEGPIIVTGGALGSLAGQVLPVSPAERKVLLAAGAAAGMAATFGAPIAAVVLAIELLLFEFSTRVLVPLVVAASVAGAMHAAFFGSGPLFPVPPHRYAGLSNLPVFAVLGVACGLLAVVVCRGLYAVESGFRRLPVSQRWHPVIGAVGFAVVGLFVPRALGVGYDSIGDVLAGRLALGALAALLVAKLVAWWVALGSGTSGGTLAPILLLSGCFGAIFGLAASDVVPSLALAPGATALVAMAATFGASTRAPFTAIVFAFELTHDFAAILPIMLATVVADLVSGALLDHGLMTEKLARRGVVVPRRYEPDSLASTRVRDVMTTSVVTVPADAAVCDARSRMMATGHGALPLVDDASRCVGIVSRTDLLDDRIRPSEPVAHIASRDVVTVAPDDTLATVLGYILDEQVEHVPVVDEGRLVGICTRTDLLRARNRHRDHERLETGWLARVGRRWPRRARAA